MCTKNHPSPAAISFVKMQSVRRAAPEKSAVLPKNLDPRNGNLNGISQGKRAKLSLKGKIFVFIVELIEASRRSRKDRNIMPKELYEKIKVRPPSPKRYTRHVHLIDEPWMRLENQKNYSPIESKMREASYHRAGTLNPIDTPKKVAYPQPLQEEFREHLVDFLM